ncbi:DUF262 domain-containing protein [Alkalispirochaeta alkalica]|uniref:DUF262 domain-containing protein n=1 Tax=Alkalispirochaeta alkalica TaxID=46356 RepID=UPI000399F4AB|nr:DUF262 domain-containing protein [Alkalispirochaeta alkalica]
MNSGLMTISDLFDGTKKFIIPKYQRAYAWEDEQIEDFFDDLYYHISAKKYFLGTILLKESKKIDDFEHLEVVDGQQRITTIVLFINQVIKKLENSLKNNKISIKIDKYIKYYDQYKLRLIENDNDFFQTYIIENKGNHNSKFTTPSQKRLFEANNNFREWLEDINIEEVEKMLSALESAEILIYSVKDSAEASLIFETTNDRGKGLTNLEKIKSHLMYKAYIAGGEKSNDLIDNIFSRFGEIYQVIERLNNVFEHKNLNFVSEDQICQYHFIAFQDWTQKKEYQNYFDTLKEIVNSYIQKNENDNLLYFIDEYSISLKEFFQSYEAVLNLNNIHLNSIFYLEYISGFYPLIVKAFILDKSTNKQDFNKILIAIEKFSFRVLAMKFKRSNDIDMTLNRAVRDFTGDFSDVLYFLTDKISEYSPKKVFLSKLKSKYFYYDYSNRAKNYIFWKYENLLRNNYQPKVALMPFEELNDKTEKYKITIEHITSQTPKNGLSFDEITENFEETYLHSLGNLTIDPKSSNSSKGNDIWDNKNKYYFEKAPFKSQLELSSFIKKTEKTWGVYSIKKRSKQIIDLIQDIWD